MIAFQWMKNVLGIWYIFKYKYLYPLSAFYYSKIGDLMNSRLSIFFPLKKMVRVYFYEDPLNLVLTSAIAFLHLLWPALHWHNLTTTLLDLCSVLPITFHPRASLSQWCGTPVGFTWRANMCNRTLMPKGHPWLVEDAIQSANVFPLSSLKR